ncbi:beta-ketoacyl synthase [Usnea florida]
MTIHDGGADRHSYQSTRTTELARRSEKRDYIQDPVTVVGMGCRLPGNSNSPHALWKFLSEGGIAQAKTMRSPGGMYLEEIDPQTFDAQFFEIPRTEAIAMDPQQRQLLEVVYESL